MISLSFVNNTIKPISTNNDLIDIFKVIKESDESIHSAIDEYIGATENNIMNEAVGLVTESDEELDKRKEGVFEKIGEVILAVFKKIQEFIDKVIRAIKDLIYRLSPVEKKLEMIKKDNPALANKVLAEIEAGNITLTDLKNLKEVDKMYAEILDAAKKKEIDPNTLKGKVELFKAKFDKLFDEDNKTVKKLQTAATIITAVTAIVFVKSKLDAALKVDMEVKKLSEEGFKRTVATVKDMRAANYDKYLDHTKLTKAEIVSNISNFAQGNFGKLISENNKNIKVLTSIMNGVAKVLNQDTDAKAFVNGIDALNAIKK
nr:MAG TPA: hypothetical protein [Caudoviricetes sp.]